MKWTSLNDLREMYLSFFESKGHLRLPSFSLVPQGDKSLLLINSGMAPMKKYFTGEQEPPRHRVTTCQKCIRTPDLERVGHTARHGTFFEMLGNFSFGDYFKKEAIAWSWEFLTSPEWLDIPKNLLWPSIYENDEEAYELWIGQGVAAEHIVRLGKEDNFWEHGSGPCGPCSEIYFDRGEKYGCKQPGCRPGCDCDRYMEIWNNVFSQFVNDGHGNYTEMATKNIDTGMGLERLACVMQGVDNMFLVDTNRRILDTVCSIAEKTYGADKNDDISIRVCTDHIKSAMFMICDGVVPSNEGRGYVLRRIIRRACRHGKLLGINRPFLAELLDCAIAENSRAYPELTQKHEYIKKVLVLEEVRFDCTIDAGLGMLRTLVDEAAKSKKTILDGADVFKLYDTYGFPVDLTREIAQESGLSVDENAVVELMTQQRQRARAARANIGGWDESSKSVLSDMPQTEFLGYTDTECQAKVLAILSDGEKADFITEGDCTVVFDRTVFYGEGGGQVGDCGTITGSATLVVTDTKKANGVYLHLCSLSDGTLRVGDTVTLTIDTARRDSIRRNHSSAHLLQAALRSVLGTHVEQAGSYVDENRVRFDFTHYAPMTEAEIAEAEKKVNEAILSAYDVVTTVTDPETARKSGAMALFGEKYGSLVRMVKMGDVSTELCGGTHVSNTANICLFKILSENSVAAGVRRIEGTTGLGILTLLNEKQQIIDSVSRELKAQNPSDLAHRIEAMKTELRDAKRDLSSAESRLASAKAESLISSAEQIKGVRLITSTLHTSPDSARVLCDTIKAQHPDVVALFATIEGDSLHFVACCGPDAVKAGANAGLLCRAVSAICGGKGGGRPDSAMSGGTDISKVPQALKSAKETVLSQLK